MYPLPPGLLGPNRRGPDPRVCTASAGSTAAALLAARSALGFSANVGGRSGLVLAAFGLGSAVWVKVSAFDFALRHLPATPLRWRGTAEK